VQEQKQVERQQHMEEQHRLHVSGNWLDQLNSSSASNATNPTDHVDDFIARIDKLRQVGRCLGTAVLCLPCTGAHALCRCGIGMAKSVWICVSSLQGSEVSWRAAVWVTMIAGLHTCCMGFWYGANAEAWLIQHVRRRFDFAMLHHSTRLPPRMALMN